MTHPAQPEIDRLYALSRQATRLRHWGWAARFEQAAVILKSQASHEIWLVTQSPRQRSMMYCPLMSPIQ